MFASILRLELEKQRAVLANVFIGMVLVCAIVFAKAIFGSQNPTDILNALALAGLIAVVPAFALLFASSAAYALRHNRQIEESLPFRPSARILGAYFSSLLCFVATALPLLLFGAAQKWLNIDYLIAGSLGVVYLHFLAFAFSYWIAQPVLGSLVALLIGATMMALWKLIERFLFLLNHQASEFLALWIAIVCAACVVIGIAGVLWLARYIERERPMRGTSGILVVAALLSSILFSYSAAGWLSARIETDLRPVFSFSWMYRATNTSTSRHGQDFLLAATLPGTLVAVDTTGNRRVLMTPQHRSLWSFATGTYAPIHSRIIDVYRDSNGRIILMFQPDTQRAPNTFEVWTSQSGEPAKRAITFSAHSGPWPQALTEINGEMHICGYDKFGVSFARLPLSGGVKLEWQQDDRFDKMPAVVSAVLSSAGAKLGRLSEDLRTLRFANAEGKIIDCNLSGRGLPTYHSSNRLLAPLAGPSINFALPIVDDDGHTHIVVCNEQGSVKMLWQNISKLSLDHEVRDLPWIFTRRNHDGATAWVKKGEEGAEQLLVLSAERQAFPPLDLNKLFAENGAQGSKSPEYLRAFVHRVRHNFAWITLNGLFLKVDLQKGSTRHLAEIASPRDLFYHAILTPAADGLFYLKDRRFYLITWDGQQKDLGRSRL